MIRQLDNPRELRGLAILSQPGAIVQIEKNVWKVRSQSIDTSYEVARVFPKDRQERMRSTGIWSCTCPDHQTRNVICKHIHAIQISLKIAGDVQEHTRAIHVGEAEPKITCPTCKSESVKKWGIRKTSYGENQRYRCSDCGHRFVVDYGFCRMKNSPKTVTLCLDLFFKGVSLRKIADHLMQVENVSVNQATVLRWIRKYLKLLAKYSEKYKVEAGNIWHCDETTVFIKKEGDKKYYQWIWNLMDAKTRYLLACEVSETRYVKDARRPLKKAKEITDVKPDAIVTDGLPAYPEAIKAEFYGEGRIQNPHIRLKDFETKPNNNIIERLQGTFRERTKVLRSFDSPEGATEFCDGMRTYYNFIRSHQGIEGLTPAQMADVPIDLMGNRWQKMIELSVR